MRFTHIYEIYSHGNLCYGDAIVNANSSVKLFTLTVKSLSYGEGWGFHAVNPPDNGHVFGASESFSWLLGKFRYEKYILRSIECISYAAILPKKRL